MTLRVALVAPVGHIGGAERWALQQLDASEPIDLHVLLLANGPLAEELAARGATVEVAATGPRPIDLLRAAVRVRAWVRRVAPDVLWANGVKAAVAAVPAARTARVPVVWVKHDFSYDRRLAPVLGRWSTRVVATSAAVGQAAGASATVIPPPLAGPSPLPADDAEQTWAAELGRDLRHPVAVSVGRLVPYKGVDVAIEALARPEAAAWELVVVGEDDPTAPGETARLRALAASRGVSGRVHLVGNVPEVGRRLAPFDAALVLTRRDDQGFGREGYSMVALEALRAGVPVIGAADSPELARMARAAGEVVSPDDIAAVADALRRSGRADDDQRSRAKAAVADHPDASATATALVRVLREASARP